MNLGSTDGSAGGQIGADSNRLSSQRLLFSLQQVPDVTWQADTCGCEPGFLAEHRLGHEVPGMRGLYAHTSDRMREDLKAALQARWEDSLYERAALHEHSPVPLLDELLAPFRAPAPDPTTPRDTQPDHPAPGGREKMISQIPPNQPESPARRSRARPPERASDLVRNENRGVELRDLNP